MQFRCNLFDPAWSFKTFSGKHTPYSRAESTGGYGLLQTKDAKVASKMGFIQYPPMSIEEMQGLPVNDLGTPKDSVLLMWVVETQIEEALKLGAMWGYKYVTFAFTWVKSTMQRKPENEGLPVCSNDFKAGPGYWSMCNPEFCLLFRRKDAKRNHTGVRELLIEPWMYELSPTDLIHANEVIVQPTGYHSRKPFEVYSRIEQLFNGPYYECFARGNRLNWVSQGNEVDWPYVGYDLRDTMPILIQANNYEDYRARLKLFAGNNAPRPDLLPQWFKEGFKCLDDWLAEGGNKASAAKTGIKLPDFKHKGELSQPTLFNVPDDTAERLQKVV